MEEEGGDGGGGILGGSAQPEIPVHSQHAFYNFCCRLYWELVQALSGGGGAPVRADVGMLAWRLRFFLCQFRDELGTEVYQTAIGGGRMAQGCVGWLCVFGLCLLGDGDVRAPALVPCVPVDDPVLLAHLAEPGHLSGTHPIATLLLVLRTLAARWRHAELTERHCATVQFLEMEVARALFLDRPHQAPPDAATVDALCATVQDLQHSVLVWHWFRAPHRLTADPVFVERFRTVGWRDWHSAHAAVPPAGGLCQPAGGGRPAWLAGGAEVGTLVAGASRWFREYALKYTDAQFKERLIQKMYHAELAPGEVRAYQRAHAGVVPGNLRSVLQFLRTAIQLHHLSRNTVFRGRGLLLPLFGADGECDEDARTPSLRYQALAVRMQYLELFGTLCHSTTQTALPLLDGEQAVLGAVEQVLGADECVLVSYAGRVDVLFGGTLVECGDALRAFCVWLLLVRVCRGSRVADTDASALCVLLDEWFERGTASVPQTVPRAAGGAYTEVELV